MKIKNINLNGHRMELCIERVFPSGAIRVDNVNGWESILCFFSNEKEAIKAFKEKYKSVIQIERGVR